MSTCPTCKRPVDTTVYVTGEKPHVGDVVQLNSSHDKMFFNLVESISETGFKIRGNPSTQTPSKFALVQRGPVKVDEGPKFKIGDSVRVKNDYYNHYGSVVGTVRSLDVIYSAGSLPQYVYDVGSGIKIYEKCLEKDETSTKVVIKFQPGQRVVVTKRGDLCRATGNIERVELAEVWQLYENNSVYPLYWVKVFNNGTFFTNSYKNDELDYA
jgi:hypothetical protein